MIAAAATATKAFPLISMSFRLSVVIVELALSTANCRASISCSTAFSL